MNDFIFNEIKKPSPKRIMLCGFSDSYAKMLQGLFAGEAVFCTSDPDLIIADEHSEPSRQNVPAVILGSVEAKRKNRLYLRRPVELKRLRELVLLFASVSPHSRKDTTVICDSEALTVSLGGKVANLTSLEYALFNLLYQKRGEVILREDINRALWQEESGSNVCDVYVCYLRKKLEPLMGQGNIISVRGKGYMMRSADE